VDWKRIDFELLCESEPTGGGGILHWEDSNEKEPASFFLPMAWWARTESAPSNYDPLILAIGKHLPTGLCMRCVRVPSVYVGVLCT